MTAASHKESNLYVKKGRRGAQTSHSKGTLFVAPDVYTASAIHVPFPRARPITPIRCQKRQLGRITSRSIFDQ